MDQPVPTVQPFVPQAPVLAPKPRNWKKILLVSFMLIWVIVLILGAYFLGADIQSIKNTAVTKTKEAALVPDETAIPNASPSLSPTPNPTPIPNPGPKIADGLTKAQKLMNQGGKTVIRSIVQISYTGILTALDPGKSWTVEKDGKSATILQEAIQKVSYVLFTGTDSPTSQAASESDLKVGDNVTITTFVDAYKGVVTVVSISFIKKV